MVWEGGKILRYPAHSVDAFLLCSEKDFELMKKMLEEVKSMEWEEVKKTEVYKAWVESLQKTCDFLNEKWNGGYDFWSDLLCTRDDAWIRMCQEKGPLHIKLKLIEYDESLPVWGIEIGHDELTIIVSALNAFFDYMLCDEGFEQIKYGSEMHNIWNRVVGD